MLQESEVVSLPLYQSSYPPPLREATPTMFVKKRNGVLEAVELDKVVRAIQRNAKGLSRVDYFRVATKTISGLYDGATTQELDELSIQTAAALTAEEPEYSLLAARILAQTIEKEVSNQNIHSFSQSIERGFEQGLIGDRLAGFVRKHARKLNASVDLEGNDRFEYFGLRTVYDRYLLRHPHLRKVTETPQYFFLRVACALSTTVPEALDLYGVFSRLEYIPSSPTLFNAGTAHEQLSSCYLLDSPQDDLIDIYKRYSDIARLSKFAGGIGVAYHRVRSRGSLIRGTNGTSNGIVPWLKTLDSSVASVNQGGRRRGACCVYLETWHADIEEFLELRENTGDEARRTHNLNLANWVPDLFMQRVEAGQDWSLFDPRDVPELIDLYGTQFEQSYCEAEQKGLAKRTIPAQALYSRMMKSLAQTGNGWMNFKDKSNLSCNQTALPGQVVHLSNLCTEILEVTSDAETAVCNLGSLNLARHTTTDKSGKVVIDYKKLAANVRRAVRQLDFVIDLNFYPIPEAQVSNSRWRPVGLGLMGLQDVFFQMRLPFDSEEARLLSKKISEHIYYNALKASTDLAEKYGPHAAFAETRAARGELQFDAWGVVPDGDLEWDSLRERVKTVGLRNSLLIAVAPTATIASIVGCYECIEPQVSNLFKRETLSGDFLQVNRYLIRELEDLGLWNDATRSKLKLSEGSIQGFEDLSEGLKLIYRTVWEVPMRSLVDMAADRGAFIDQSQSLNLFVESPTIGKPSSMYMHAWKRGLKTTYYLRSRPATKIAQTTMSSATKETPLSEDLKAVVCSLENPESCEACQ